jgi:dTDP-4-dehydrorhamnose reductase
MNILGTGLSGLVGSRVVELMSPEFSFENLSLETGVDITDKSSVDSYFGHSDASWVFHMAAYTDVQTAENDRPKGESSTAWKVNVLATENIVANCRKFRKKLLYVDTDYAFDGKKSEYTEADTPNPLGWYARTKYEGAKRVLALGGQGLVIRIANPYRAHPVGLSAQPGKKDFVHKILERLESRQTVIAPTDQLFTPTFVDDIAYALRALIQADTSGIYHVVGSSGLSPFDGATLIAQIFGYDTALVKSSTFKEMFASRAPAPQYAFLKNDKIRRLGISMRTFAEGLTEVKKQESVSHGGDV